MSRKQESDAHQIERLFRESKYVEIGYGKDKHTHYLEAAEKGITTSHGRAAITPIKNEKTLKKYRGIYKEFAKFSRLHGYGRNISNYPPQAVREFLDFKAISGIQHQRAADICSALDKLDDIINAANKNTGRDLPLVNYEATVQKFRSSVLPDIERSPQTTRAFNDPEAVIAHLPERAAAVASIQLHYGLRVDNALNFKLNNDGTISFTAKGGKTHAHYKLEVEDYKKICALVSNTSTAGEINLLPYSTYIHQLQRACREVGEKYTGSHAFRHTHAQRLYKSLINQGLSKVAAKAAVSEDLFHKRLEIVNLYLR